VNFGLKVVSQLRNTISGENTEIMSQRPFFPTFAVRRPVSTSPCHYLQNKDAHSKGNEISESGWTMYFDQSLDSWSDKNSNEFDIQQRHRKVTERYPAYHSRASSIRSNEENYSMASDASSGPQMPPLPVQDIEFEQERQGTGSYSSLSTRKHDVHLDKREDLECVASSSAVDVNPRKYKFRKVHKSEHADLLLEDTASSSVRHRPEVSIRIYRASFATWLELLIAFLSFYIKTS